MYSEYLDAAMTTDQLNAERKKQLSAIATIRKRDVLVFAADLMKGGFAQIAIDYSDILPVRDQLENLSGTALDLILETPGGSGEVAEQIIRIIRDKYEDLAVIVPGAAMSAGTIMAMAADDILMGKTSALGPIDAQIQRNGKVFSADALLEGFEKIKKEVESTGQLNKAYIPILQAISPGELQAAQNAQDFSRDLVQTWLAKYKFKNWKTHSSTGANVTEGDRAARAKQIADGLCDHGEWLTHGRPLRREDLERLRLRVTDYETDPQLSEAIRRYHTLLQMTLSSAVYKLFETPTSQIFRMVNLAALQQAQPQQAQGPQAVVMNIKCGKCGVETKVQANLGQKQPPQQGCIPYPADNTFRCPQCSQQMDLLPTRRQLEMQFRQPVVI